MQVTAQLNYLRIAPRKVRLVARRLRGLDVNLATSQLKYTVKRASHPILKLLNSAVANAENNHGLHKETLYIKDLIVNEGIKLKRFKPKGFGMVMPIQRKSSNIKIILDQLDPERLKKVQGRLARRKYLKPVEEVRTELKPLTETRFEKKTVAGKPTIQKIIGRKSGVLGNIRNIGRKMFRRKSV